MSLFGYTEEELVDLNLMSVEQFVTNYPHRTIDGATRKKYRNIKDQTVKEKIKEIPVEGNSDVTGIIWAYLLKHKKAGTSIEDICDALKVVPRQVRESITQLQQQSKVITINNFGDVAIAPTSTNPNNPIIHLPDPGKVFRFGVIGDTHLVSTHDRIGALNSYYDYVQENGINLVLHAGDLFDGMDVYKGHNNAIRFSGFDRHMEYGLNEYPYRAGIKTILIGGNHDESFIKLAGVDPVAHFVRQREDCEYIGMYDGLVDIGGVTVNLHHGHGYSYAQSYMLQKYVEKIPVKERPDIFACGHWHHAISMLGYQGVDSFSVGCFQGRTGLLKRLGGYPTIGGWIMEVEHANEKLIRTKAEFLHLD